MPTGVWGLIALKLTRHPIMALVMGLLVLCPPAILGYLHEDDVTYDISSQLNTKAESRQGLELLAKHFDIGRVNPTTVLMQLRRVLSLRICNDRLVSLRLRFMKWKAS